MSKIGLSEFDRFRVINLLKTINLVTDDMAKNEKTQQIDFLVDRCLSILTKVDNEI